MVRRRRLAALASLVLLQLGTAAGALGIVVLGMDAARDDGEVVVRSWPTVAAARPALVAPSTGGRVRPGAVADALAGHLDSAALGGSVAAAVADPRTGTPLFRQRSDVPATPASTAKIATAVAALTSLGPNHRLTTSVVRPPSPGGAGAAAGEQPIFLVGGGDPTLASPGGASLAPYPKPAELGDLAQDTARGLRRAGVTTVRLRYDASLFTGPATGPGWTSSYIDGGHVAPVSALAVDAGRLDPGADTRTTDPAGHAAEMFADLLEKGGISVVGPTREERAPGNAEPVAAVSSPPTSALVERMLTESDNDLAEALARQVAVGEGRPASFAGAADAVHGVLTGLGVAEGVRLVDGSGLSPHNEMTAEALADLLTLAASPAHPELRPVVTGLPVAAFSGTLSYRYGGSDAGAGAGLVRAKTGTLNGVSSLAGVVQTAGGRLLVFAFLADEVPGGGTYAAEGALDTLAAALARCRCA